MALLTAFVVALIPSAVAAHAGLAAASPGPEAVVGGEVVEIELFYADFITTFDGDVTAPSGETLAAEPTMVSDIAATITLAAPITEPGEYQVRHVITSLDGDVVEKDYRFTFDPSAPPAQMVFVPEEEESTPWFLWVALGAGFLVIAVLGWQLAASMRRRRATLADG